MCCPLCELRATYTCLPAYLPTYLLSAVGASSDIYLPTYSAVAASSDIYLPTYHIWQPTCEPIASIAGMKHARWSILCSSVVPLQSAT